MKPLSLILMGLALAAGAAAARPNILFAVADDMSHASAYGYAFVSTPNVDGLAQRGVKFTRMYTPSSKCAPSRAVMLTGRNPWQLKGAANHQPVWPVEFKSFVEVLEEHGYFAGFTGKGWNPGIHPPGRQLTGRPYNDHKIGPTPLKVSPFDYTENFRQFMRDRPEGQPFFFWYGAKEPHRGYAFKSGVKAGKTFALLDFLPSFWGGADAVKHDILDYAVEVEYFDQHLGRILRILEESGELENTLIIATSDNAMPFPRYKGHPHEFATRVPFVAAWPGHIKNPGRDSAAFASFIDIAPTFLEAAGITDPDMRPIQGQSLFDIFACAPKGRDQVLTGRERNDMCRPNGWGYPVRSLHRGDWVYLHNFEPSRWPCGTEAAGFRDTDWSPTKADIMYNQKGSAAWELCFGKRPAEELYQVKADPECLNNLALNPEYDAMRRAMRDQLFALLKAEGDPRMLGDPGYFDRQRPERIPEYDELVERMKKKK